MRVATFGLIVVLGWLATATGSRAATLFTVAGVESTSAFAPAPCWKAEVCTIPRRWPATWVTTECRLRASCLTHLADGTILVCQGSELLALGRDGHLRHWLPTSVRLGVGPLTDADVAPDGSVVVLGARGVVRALAGGVIRALASGTANETPFGSAVAAMRDGSVMLSGSAEAADLSRLGPGRNSFGDPAGAPVGRAAEFASDPFDDLVALSDGSVLIAQHGRRRVLRVDAVGRVEVVAGGGRDFVAGGLATAVDLGAVTAVAAGRHGGLLLSADRGLFRVNRDGRLRRVAGGTAYEYDPVEARALTTDGQVASKAMLAGV